jgi:hypothetical protein
MPLPKYVSKQITPGEIKQLKKYEITHATIQETMITAQGAYTQYVRASGENMSLKVRRMADKVFKYMLKRRMSGTP